jgi:hypothetical protein
MNISYSTSPSTPVNWQVEGFGATDSGSDPFLSLHLTTRLARATYHIEFALAEPTVCLSFLMCLSAGLTFCWFI